MDKLHIFGVFIIVLVLLSSAVSAQVVSPKQFIQDNEIQDISVKTKPVTVDDALKIGRPSFERHQISYLKRDKLKIEKRVIVSKDVKVLQQRDKSVILPKVQCHGARTDMLLEEDFTCDGLLQTTQRDVHLYTNKGKDYAHITLDFSNELYGASDATLLIDHAVESPYQQSTSVYGLVDEVWRPVCDGLTTTRKGSTSECDVSHFISRYKPEQTIFRVEWYAREGPSLIDVNTVNAVVDSTGSLPLYIGITSISTGSLPPHIGIVPIDKNAPPPPTPNPGGDNPTPSTRNGHAELTDEGIVTLIPTFAQSTSSETEVAVEETEKTTEDTFVEAGDVSSLTGAAVGALQGSVLAIVFLVALLGILAFGAYGQKFGKRRLRRKLL